MIRYGAYGGHHIGTARMGSDPRTSVVDANCRLHSVRNLYIAGSAVFPTSSQANPTLTIVALARCGWRATFAARKHGDERPNHCGIRRGLADRRTPSEGAWGECAGAPGGGGAAG